MDRAVFSNTKRDSVVLMIREEDSVAQDVEVLG